MSTFLLIHHFPASFQGSPETAAAAKGWFASLGAAIPGRSSSVDDAALVRLGDCGTAEEQRFAYTLIATDDLEAATAVAQAWPLLTRGGGVEVRGGPNLDAECSR